MFAVSYNPSVTESQTAAYKIALKQARTAFEKATDRLEEITQESQKLTDEITRLRRTITALAALCSEDPGFDDYGITEACMEFMESAKTLLTTNEVVAGLDAMGFDLSSQQNAGASVHAVLSRLAFKGIIDRMKKEGSKTIFWKGPNAKEETEITDEDIPF
jgi:hypothetical protein